MDRTTPDSVQDQFNLEYSFLIDYSSIHAKSKAKRRKNSRGGRRQPMQRIFPGAVGAYMRQKCVFSFEVYSKLNSFFHLFHNSGDLGTAPPPGYLSEGQILCLLERLAAPISEKRYKNDSKQSKM